MISVLTGYHKPIRKIHCLSQSEDSKKSGWFFGHYCLCLTRSKMDSPPPTKTTPLATLSTPGESVSTMLSRFTKLALVNFMTRQKLWLQVAPTLLRKSSVVELRKKVEVSLLNSNYYFYFFFLLAFLVFGFSCALFCVVLCSHVCIVVYAYTTVNCAPSCMHTRQQIMHRRVCIHDSKLCTIVYAYTTANYASSCTHT